MLLSVNEQSFNQEVLKSSQPVLVHFWAPWCGLCRMIEPLLIQWQAEFSEPIKLVSINADENFKLANSYRLKNLPTIMLFERGNLLTKVDNFQNREGLKQTLTKIVSNYAAQSA
ncbi:Thioredoxin domain-containing protein [Stanieria cyanosphaera PCC 7437]|uniref:Thioredoxin n=1 Tax=Stanieria cyanosphaera (strain ATCC 29371 / PCC 7437) TaxID=111780 RepID=K9XNS6_STAC7|nr:thioredoxin domain-containing protein [Stanieria cyanosphaera]AFZ33734.1 Thioredoxin domain-containing protein [Stanieria cyanosphaera PCC 7437]